MKKSILEMVGGEKYLHYDVNNKVAKEYTTLQERIKQLKEINSDLKQSLDWANEREREDFKRIADLERENEELKERLLKNEAHKIIYPLGDITELERVNTELKDDNKVMADNYSKMEQKFYDNLAKAKAIIGELSKSLFLAKGIIRDLIDDTVDFKESKERAMYCYEQEKFDTYKKAEQFLKED